MRVLSCILSVVALTSLSPAWSQTAEDFKDGWTVMNALPKDFAAMLDAGGDMNQRLANGDRPLHVVLRVSDAYKVGVLLDRGADVTLSNDAGETPLHLAAQSRYLDAALVQRIIDAGANLNAPNANGETPYDVAEDYGAWATRDLIAKAGGKAKKSDPAASLQSPLAADFAKPAVLSGSGDGYFQDMINAGADVNHLLPNGDRPLHVVLRAASVFKGNLLIDKGADVTAANDLGETPLHAAAQEDYLGAAIIDRMIAKGADVNAKNNAGQTPLDVANAYASWEILAALTAKGGVSGAPAPAAADTAKVAPEPQGNPTPDMAARINLNFPGSAAFKRTLREGGDAQMTQQDRAVAGGLALVLLECQLAIDPDERAALAAFATSESLAAPLGHGDAFKLDLDFAMMSIFQGTMGASAGIAAGAALGCGGDAPTILAKRILKALGYRD